ncbi:transposase, partial [Mycobacterium tuberculosis TB_RSA162]
FFAAELDRPAR